VKRNLVSLHILTLGELFSAYITQVRLLSSMDSLVSLQTTFQTEIFATINAVEGFLLLVDHTLVYMKHISITKTFATINTAKGLQLLVDTAQVLLHIRALIEKFATDFARGSFQLLVDNSFVLFQSAKIGETYTTVGAPEGLHFHVASAFVSLQTAISTKTLITRRTLKGFLSGVHSHVTFFLAMEVKCFVAEITLKSESCRRRGLGFFLKLMLGLGFG